MRGTVWHSERSSTVFRVRGDCLQPSCTMGRFHLRCLKHSNRRGKSRWINVQAEQVSEILPAEEESEDIRACRNHP